MASDQYVRPHKEGELGLKDLKSECVVSATKVKRMGRLTDVDNFIWVRWMKDKYLRGWRWDVILLYTKTTIKFSNTEGIDR